MNESEMKNKLEDLLKDYDFTPQYQVDVMGKKVDVPVKYSDASAFMAFFPISIKKAKELLGTDRLKPVSIFGGRCLLGVTIFDYRECPVGLYHEFTFSIPVMVDSKFSIPVIPIVFDSLFPKFGYHVILMGADTDISRKHIDQIFPYPTVNKDLGIGLKEEGKDLFAFIKDGEEKIISMRQKLPAKYKLVNKRYNTYYKKDGKIYRVKLNTFSYWSMMFSKKNIQVDFGKHDISKMLKNLDINPNPIMSIYYKQAIEIATAGEEI